MRRKNEGVATATAMPAQIAFDGWLPAEDHERDTDHWYTPPELVEVIADFFGGQIDLDPCWSPDSHVEPLLGLTIRDDGLACDWPLDHPHRYVNPPYSNPGPWLDRIAAEQQGGGGHTIALLKVDTSTRWWKRCWEADAICWLANRVPYVPRRGELAGKRGVPFWASALVYWGDSVLGFSSHFCWLGHITLGDQR